MRHIALGLVLGLVGALGTVLACSGDRGLTTDPAAVSPDPDADAVYPDAQADVLGSLPDNGPVSPGALCASTYGTLHDSYDACCTASDRSSLRYQLVFGQLGVIKESCTPQLEASASAGRIELDSTEFHVCTARFAAFFAGGACGKDLSPYLDFVTIDGCRDAVNGNQAVGKPCLRDYECENGLTCVGFAGQNDGLCTRPPPLGEACGGGKTDAGGGDAVIAFAFGVHPKCETAATCNRSTGRCVASLEENAACSDTEQCNGGLTCLLGKCSADAPSPAGGPCRSNKDCSGIALFCELGAAGTPGKCAPRKPAGAACTAPGALGGSSCSGQCVAPDGGAAPQCVSFCGSG